MFTALMLTFAASILGPLVGPIMPQADPVQDGIDAWRKAAGSAIEDDAKKEEALAVIDKVDEGLKERRKVISEAMTQFVKIDQRYSASAAEYDAGVVELNRVWGENEAWLLANLLTLKGLMTDAEWKEAAGKVDEKLKDQWDTLKETQKTLRKTYQKKQDKVKDKYE